MLSLEQIQRELRAIEQFDILFFAERLKRNDDSVAFVIRQIRKLELLQLLEGLAHESSGAAVTLPHRASIR